MKLKLNFEGFEGHVTMAVATNLERLELMDDLGVNIMKMKDGDKDDEGFLDSIMSMSSIIKMLKCSEKYYREVALKKDGKSYLSFDDLNADSECSKVMITCAQKCIMSIGTEEGKK